MQAVLIHLCLVTLLVTMVALASSSDVLIFKLCSLNIKHVSASSWIFEYSLSLVVFTVKTKHLSIKNLEYVSISKSDNLSLVSYPLIQKKAKEVSCFVIAFKALLVICCPTLCHR